MEQKSIALESCNNELVLLVGEKERDRLRIKKLNMKALEANQNEMALANFKGSKEDDVDDLEFQIKWYHLIVKDLKAKLESSRNSETKALGEKEALVSANTLLEAEVHALKYKLEKEQSKTSIHIIALLLFCSFLQKLVQDCLM